MRPRFTAEQIDELPPLLSIQQAAQLLRWDHGTLTREVKDGTFPIPGIKKGERLVLPKRALLDLIGHTTAA